MSTSYSYQYCIIYRRTFLGPNRLLKTQIFEKKGKIFTDKKFGVFLSRFIECDEAQETKYKGPRAIFIIALQFIRACLGTKRLMKTQIFEKKRQTFQWKESLDQFFPYYRASQNSRNNLKGTIRFSGIYCGSNQIISLGPKCCWKNNFSRKNAHFPRKKRFWLIFPVLSKMTNVRKRFLRAHKVIWQIICKW